MQVSLCSFRSLDELLSKKLLILPQSRGVILLLPLFMLNKTHGVCVGGYQPLNEGILGK